MELARARALFDPDRVRLEQHDPARDRTALRRLAVWAQRFSPVVAVDDTSSEGDMSPDGLLLDLSGCAPTWGGEGRLVEAAMKHLQRLGFNARIATGPTFGCAWAIARFGDRNASIVEIDDVRTALAPMPIAALRVDSKTIEQLAHVGIERVSQLLDMPRATLPSRFGETLLLRLDQALGHAIETIEPIRPVPPPRVERVFDGPTDRIEAIEHTVRELLEQITHEFARRGCGARCLDIELLRSDLGPERLSVTLGLPSRSPKHLWQLIRPKLERAHLGFGVEAIRMEARAVAPIRHEQAEHAHASQEASPSEADRAWAELLDTLGNQLGVDRVLRAELRASHLPERAFRMGRAGEAPERVQAGVTQGDRPTVLFEHPDPVDVIALTPDGPVHRVRWRGEDLAVSACTGPERIGSEWWRSQEDGSDRSRDYFMVDVEDGRRIWIARSIQRERWYVHGIWA